MLSKFKNSKGTCDYLTVGGVRVPSRNVLITITDSNGNVRSSSISTKSKGNKGAHTTPSKLKKMLKNNPGMTVTAQVKIDEGSAHALSASMVFDPSRCRGKDVDGTASIDEAWSDVPDALWDVALKGVSYGKYKGNIRQMKWLIENGKSIEGISSIIITPNTYSPHPSAEIITMALIDYIDAGHTLPGALGAMLTSDEMLLPPDAIKRAQTLGYGNTMSPSNLRNGYSFLRDSTLPSSVKASYMQQAAATATFASSANRLTEQAVLNQVALSDSDERVRLSAVERVTDQAVLSQVALNDSDNTVRRYAVDNLTDQAILSQVVLNDSDNDVRRAAVGRVTDQDILSQVALNDSEKDVRERATSLLTDEAILTHIANNDRNHFVRREADLRLERLAKLSHASGKASGKASAKEQWAAKLAAGRCPVCDGKPFEIILMSGNTGCIDCASTGKASVYTSRRVGKK